MSLLDTCVNLNQTVPHLCSTTQPQHIHTHHHPWAPHIHTLWAPHIHTPWALHIHTQLSRWALHLNPATYNYWRDTPMRKTMILCLASKKEFDTICLHFVALFLFSTCCFTVLSTLSSFFLTNRQRPTCGLHSDMVSMIHVK